MSLSQALLPEFDNEMMITRKTLAQIPEDKFDWKPHDKSATLGSLATHLANLPTWASLAIEKDVFDLAPPDAPAPHATPAATRDEILETFDRNVAAARELIAAASDEQLAQKWTLLNGGKEIMSLPRVGVLRGFVMNHTIHHRAQVGVYLRLNDVPVPSVYGPSADENPF